MRTFAAAILLIVAGAVAPTAHPPAAAPAACTYSYDWQVTGSGTSQGAGATWDVSCGLTMQVRALCHNFVTGTSYYAYSGEVKGLGILDWAGCGFADSVLAGQIQPTDCDCSTWHTFWTGGRKQ